jgi:hypothetical protein
MNAISGGVPSPAPPTIQSASTPLTTDDLDKRVRQFLMVRKKLQELDKAHKALLLPYQQLLVRLNNLLLGNLNDTKSECVRTAAGSFYKLRQHFVSVADPKAFREWVLATDSWNVADLRANKTGVVAMVQLKEPPPPGVNYVENIVAGVRSAGSPDDKEA